MTWQPIETAPRDQDGSILLFCPHDGIFQARRRKMRPGWRVMANDYEGANDSAGDMMTNTTATHWMPLPEPPQ